MSPMMVHGAGGTRGGLGQFFFGVGLAAIGFYLFFERVSVVSRFGSLWGGHPGLLLLPLGLGVGLLFFNGRSVLGRLLVGGALLTTFVAIIANLTFFFVPTRFVHAALMVSLIGAGFVAMFRSLRAS